MHSEPGVRQQDEARKVVVWCEEAALDDRHACSMLNHVISVADNRARMRCDGVFIAFT